MPRHCQRSFAITLALLMVLAALPVLGGADGDGGAEVLNLDEVAGGTLLLASGEGGEFALAPIQATEVEIVVRGLVARARVVQRFTNPLDSWVEGVYVFPLPEDAAVDHLHMVVGGFEIVGEIMDREEAREAYEEARDEGRAASLLEQQRPNIFTTSVANIGPGDQLEVTIEYQQGIRLDAGECELRFPMVVGPRYSPGVAVVDADGSVNTDRVPDASAVTPPILESDMAVNPVRLSVDLDAGLPLEHLESPYHPIVTTPEGDMGVLVELEADTVPANRDFVLRWAVVPAAETRATVFVEELDGEYYVMLYAVPPAAEYAHELRLPRELILVIDTSGSMDGDAIKQARKAVLFALGQLQPDDWFNVMAFDDDLSVLFEASRQAFPATVEVAREWVRDLEADGGTEMLPALEAALADRKQLGLVRQVVFVTDGSVSNEDELLGVIRRDLGRSRLFTVGIGSAPNSHFMERSARFGRGSHTHVGSTREVAERMQTLFAKLSNPVLGEIELRWPDPAAEQWPRILPDLYTGEPLVVSARLATIAGEAVVTGVRGVEPWEMRLPLDLGEERAGVHQLWARRKIEALMDRALEKHDRDAFKTEVVEVARRHHLVCPYTSLVAVDSTYSRPVAEELVSTELPVNLPQHLAASGGWLAQEIVVTSQVWAVDVTGCACSTILNDHLLDKAPVGMAGRTVVAVASNATGWSFSAADGSGAPGRTAGIAVPGHPGITVHGDQDGNGAFFINGVFTTVPVGGSGVTPFLEAVEEVKVEVAGGPAEIGPRLGAAVDLVTKSGTNQYGGIADLRWSGDGMTESDHHFDADSDANRHSVVSASFGGPFVKDKLWFFAAGEQRRSTVTPTGAESERRQRDVDWMARLTWGPIPDVRFDLLSFGGSNRTHDVDAGRFVAQEATSGRRAEGELTRLSLISLPDDDVIVEAHVGLEDHSFDLGPESEDLSLAPILDLDSRMLRGSAAGHEHTTRSNHHERAMVKYFLDDLLGPHELGFGVEHRGSRYATSRSAAGGGLRQVLSLRDPLTNPMGSGQVDVDGDGYQDLLLITPGDGAGERIRSDGDLWSGFLQDKWIPTPNLTLEPGLRLDRVRTSGHLGRDLASFHAWQPRLAVAWDPFGNGRTAVRGSWGLSMHPSALTIGEAVADRWVGWSEWVGYESLCSDPADTSDPACDPVWLAANVALDGQTRVTVDVGGNRHQWFLRSRFGADPYQTVDTLGAGRLQAPEVTTLALAVEQEVGYQNSVELRWVRQRTTDLLDDACVSNAWLWDSSVAEPDLADPQTWPAAGECTGFVLANMAGSRRDDTTWSLAFTSRREWLSFVASYSYQRSWGNVPVAPGGASTAFDLYPRDFLNLSGASSEDRRHRVKLNGVMVLPAEVNLAVDLEWASAPALATWAECSRVLALGPQGLEAEGFDPLLLAACVLAGGSGTIVLEPRGSNRGHSDLRLDIALSKTFYTGGVTLEPVLAIVNVLGEELHETYFTEALNPAWEHGRTTSWAAPRSYEVGLRIEF